MIKGSYMLPFVLWWYRLYTGVFCPKHLLYAMQVSKEF